MTAEPTKRIGPTHPDVFVLMSMFREVPPGTTISHKALLEAIGNPPDRVYRQRMKTAKNQLREHGIQVEVDRGKGYRRLTPEEGLLYQQQTARPSLYRQARRTEARLNAIDAEKLSPEQQRELGVERVITHLAVKTTRSQTTQKLLAHAQATTQALPMAKALEILSNGHAEK